MASENETWALVEKEVQDEGIALYDIDFPKNGQGVFRVYIAKQEMKATGQEGAQRESVTFDECTKVTHRVLDLDEKLNFIPEGVMLEVSSPGINRKLRRPEHFETALGERAKVKYRNPEGGSKVVTGIVKSFENSNLVLEVNAEEVSVPLADVKEARIDFIFPK